MVYGTNVFGGTERTLFIPHEMLATAFDDELSLKGVFETLLDTSWGSIGIYASEALREGGYVGWFEKISQSLKSEGAQVKTCKYSLLVRHVDVGTE